MACFPNLCQVTLIAGSSLAFFTLTGQKTPQVYFTSGWLKVEQWKVVSRGPIMMNSKSFSYTAFKTMEGPNGTINLVIYLQYLELS